MKIYTSYFYKIRFMKPYQIPISTAIWDPKWFHEFKDQNHKYIDKNGVINGLRCELLKPGNNLHGLCCGKPCIHKPEDCKFLRGYRDQIFSLDKNELLTYFDKISKYMISKFNILNEPEIILIVHEDPNNTCSERKVIQDYFKCIEWEE